MSQVKYPNISVVLIGEDSNVFSIISRVSFALRNGGVSKEEISDFTNKCFSAGSYEEVLGLVMETVSIEDEESEDDDEGNYIEDEDDLEEDEEE